MPTTSAKVVLRVDAATARAYNNASPDDRDRAESAFALSLVGRRKTADELIQYMDEMAHEAKKRGLTPEILDDILNDRPASPEERAGSDNSE